MRNKYTSRKYGSLIIGYDYGRYFIAIGHYPRHGVIFTPFPRSIGESKWLQYFINRHA